MKTSPHAYNFVGSARPELASCAKSKKSWMTASAPIHKSHKKKKLVKSWKLADARLRSLTWVTSFDPGLPDPVRYTEKVKSHCYRQGYHWSRTKNKEAVENFIILLQKKAIVFVCTTDVRSYVCQFISRGTILFSNVVFSTSFLESLQKTFFSHSYFLTQLNAKPSQQNQLS